MASLNTGSNTTDDGLWSKFVELLHSCFYKLLVCYQEDWCDNDNVSITYKLRKLEYEAGDCRFVSSGIIFETYNTTMASRCGSRSKSNATPMSLSIRASTHSWKVFAYIYKIKLARRYFDETMYNCYVISASFGVSRLSICSMAPSFMPTGSSQYP